MKGKTLALLAAGSWLAFRAYRWATQYDLRGKAVLVTGGSRGLGLQMAEALGEMGARVVPARKNAMRRLVFQALELDSEGTVVETELPFHGKASLNDIGGANARSDTHNTRRDQAQVGFRVKRVGKRGIGNHNLANAGSIVKKALQLHHLRLALIENPCATSQNGLPTFG